MLGMMGTGAELLLLNHVESAAQIIPVALLSVALPMFFWLAVLQRPVALLSFKAMMASFVVAGLLGMFFHYRGAREFQLEVDPALKGTALFWKTVRAKAPPALAPASLIGLGLVGFAYTFTIGREE